MNTLEQSVVGHNVGKLKELLKQKDAKTLLNKRNQKGYTLLHIAAKCGNLEVIKILVGQGSELSIKVFCEFNTNFIGFTN
jgi:ankyrin repeat protein